MQPTEIVLVNCDDYKALYVDGKLWTYDDYYNFDFAYGVKIVSEYPNFTFEEKEVDSDWLFGDEACGDMPKELSEVRFV